MTKKVITYRDWPRGADHVFFVHQKKEGHGGARKKNVQSLANKKGQTVLHDNLDTISTGCGEGNEERRDNHEWQ